ncbi:hypothetical protein G3I59_09880 [Amycolatopsis rubida]|uniref:Integral membrane protein n=1 Tax=Amycolatopsis rubida TaxID=112413 RepID=A0ABX0BSU7_9PSEU|nr:MULTISPECIES: hypothetical protein [Amycolatopsis]MYW90903.1 hypothetical protein [Amycolatopsis rubida]NEC55888.1 hypothetical protein [Amycolatopsis rubida]OAP26031.1 hypothetical protein A4R44_03408 [Amycolatopsis sp. M39]
MSDLKRRYRRLLALYPLAHRAAHGEEMLGVLLDGAGNRSKPGVAETLDLVWGAAQVHWRHALSKHSRRDTLAIVSLLAPVLLLTGAASTVREIRSVARLDSAGLRMWFGALADVPVWSGWLAAVVLGVCGMRRASVILAWVANAALITVALLDPARHWSVDMAPGWVLLSVFAALAMTASPGPRHGLALLGRLRLSVLTCTVVVLLGLTTTVRGMHLPLAQLVQLAVLVAGVFAACRLRVRSGRRAALILLAPLIVVPVAARLLGYLDVYPVLPLVLYAAPVVVTLGFGVLLHRFDRHSRATSPDSPIPPSPARPL